MARDERPAVLLVHGWATDKRVWEGHASHLSLKRIVVNLTLPGHGPGRGWDSNTIEPAVSAIEEAMDGYEGRAVGIGWSLGAQAVVAAAARDRGLFEKVVLVGATPCFTRKKDFPEGQPRPLVRRMILDFKKSPQETLRRFYPLNFTADELRTPEAAGFLRDFEHFPLSDAEGLTRSLETLYTLDLRDSLRLVDVPTLVMHGGLDAVVDVKAAHFLASRIRGAGLVVFETAGHAPFITEPQRFREVVSGFIERP